ncbi:MAG: hypothetical protein R6X12_01180 [bacterium]
MSAFQRPPAPKKHHNWRRYEERAITRYARRLARGRFDSALEAARACREELASHGVVLSVEAVRRRMRDRRDELNLAVRNTWWIPAEHEILERHARALAANRVRLLAAAVAACRRDLDALHRRLARESPAHPLAGLGRPATTVEDKLRARARVLNPTWRAGRWNDAERQIAERFARAVVAGRYARVGQAAQGCHAELAAKRVGPPRTRMAVNVFVGILTRRLGLRHASPWTLAQDRVVDRYVRELVRGRHPSLFDAARACTVELARAAGTRRRRKSRSDEHRHPLSSVVTRIRGRARELGLTWSKGAYLPEEDRVVDRFARAVVAGRYRSVRAAVGPCLEELRALHRALAKRAGIGTRYSPGRRWEGVCTRINQRSRELGRRRVTYVRWAGWEKRLLERWCGWYELWHDRRPKWALGDAVTGLQDALGARGARRSRDACKTALVVLHRRRRLG